MDRQIEKYRFGKTLQLEPSIYVFKEECTWRFPVQTLCLCVADEIEETFPQHNNPINNVYVFDDCQDQDYVRYILNYKWFISGYVCCG